MSARFEIDRDGLVEATRRLVRIRSDEGHERACQEMVAEEMKRLTGGLSIPGLF